MPPGRAARCRRFDCFRLSAVKVRGCLPTSRIRPNTRRSPSGQFASRRWPSPRRHRRTSGGEVLPALVERGGRVTRFGALGSDGRVLLPWLRWLRGAKHRVPRTLHPHSRERIDPRAERKTVAEEDQRLDSLESGRRRTDLHKAVFRTAAQHGLLEADECQRWLEYRDSRNDTAHQYGEGFAEAAVRQLPQFVLDAKSLARRLHAHGDG